MQDAQIRLDILAMAHERARRGYFKSWRNPGLDASSSFGHNWLLAREDVSEFARRDGAPATDAPLTVDLNARLRARILLLSTLGYGRVGLIKKAFK